MKNHLTLLSVVLLFTASGCGDPKVTGTVKYDDGEPLSTGMIVFQNDRSQGIGLLKEDGSFNLYQFSPGDGLKPGVYRGYLSSTVRTDAQGKAVNLVLDKYSDIEQAGLVYDSEKDQGRIDIVLEKPPHLKSNRKP